MHTSIRRALPKLLVLSLIALAVGFLGLRGGSVSTTDTADASFTASTTASLSTHALGASADITYQLDVADGDYNFGAVNTLSPPQGDLHDQISPGSAPALGDVVGTLISTTHLGLSNLNCQRDPATALTVEFVLMNAIRDNSAGTVQPDNVPPSGGFGRLYAYMQDDGAAQDGTAEGPPNIVGAQSTAGNGLAAGVEEYPTFLQTIFNNGAPVYPAYRYFGGTFVAGTAVILNYMLFNPGTLSVFPAPNPAMDVTDVRMGYASITVLQDTSATAAPSSITDFCSPLATTSVLFGQTHTNSCLPAGACAAGGAINTPCSVQTDTVPPILARCDDAASLSGRIRWENPGTAESGTCLVRCTRFFLGDHYSLRDSDGDGLENAFDTCPYTPTGTYDPRAPNLPVSADDADGDMLPGGGPNGGCDPTPAVDVGGGNQEGDTFTNGAGWQNAGDNCPLTGNGSNAENELNQSDAVSRPRGGTQTDSMGDACDGGENSAADCAAIPTATAACGTAAACTNAVDDDSDGLVNDGCPTVGAFPETGCLNAVDDKDENPAPGAYVTDDTVVNDGCPSSSGVANGAWYATLTVDPECFSNTPAVDDTDGDGWCDTITAIDAPNGYDMAIPADPNDAAPGITPEAYAAFFPLPLIHSGASGSNPPARQPVEVCNDGINNDGLAGVDLLDSGSGKCRPPQPLVYATNDTDGDGISDEAEIHVGTDALGRCEESTAATQPGSGPTALSTDWPLDFVGGALSFDKVQIGDLSSYVAPTYRLGTNPVDPGFDRRWDTKPGPGVLTTWINVQDLSVMTLSQPPMFGGATNAFSGPSCTSPQGTDNLND